MLTRKDIQFKDGVDHPIHALVAAKALLIELPTIEQLGIWVVDCVCESVLGNTVEPDGYDEDGSPSWLIVYGLI